MLQSDLRQLLGLGAVLLIAVGSLLALLRFGGRSSSRHELVVGYPPELFPLREVARGGPLVALVETQLRLLSIYRQLPGQSDLQIWLRAFLVELREIMDTAYRVAAITRIYGQPLELERLAHEVRQLEAEVAAEVTRRLLSRDGDAQSELLDGRLATLRLCVRELAHAVPGF